MVSPAYVKAQAVRARVEAIYNRPESDFPDRPAYDDYLEEREDIIYELTEGGAVAEAEAKLAEHQRVHGAAIAAAAAARAEGVRQQQAGGGGDGGTDADTSAPPVDAAAAPPPPPPPPAPTEPLPPLSPGAARAAAGAAAGWDPGAAAARCWKAAFRSMFVR